MNKNEIIRVFFLPVYKPVKGITLLIRNKKKLAYSVLVFLFLGVIYTISVQLAYIKGIRPSVTPFINIPVENYYYWQRFWQVPLFFVTSIVFTGIVRLFAYTRNGKGNFVDLFCIVSAAQTFPMFITMWVPETIGFIFFSGSYMPVIVDILRQIIGIIWPLAIIIKGITISEEINLFYSLLFTIIASIPMTVLMVVFIR